MRRLACFLVASFAALAPAAKADPPYEARTAVGACLAAVIDKAPVSDAQGQDVSIRRREVPNTCVATVQAGEPSEVRGAVLAVVQARPERFAPARTAWAPGAFASRETFCNAPGRRALNVVLETARPGGSPVFVATVAEVRARDPRCDADLGEQAP